MTSTSSPATVSSAATSSRSGRSSAGWHFSAAQGSAVQSGPARLHRTTHGRQTEQVDQALSEPWLYCFPYEHVNHTALEPTSNRSHCPYKGIADHYWSVCEQPDALDVAWSYSAPLPAVAKVAGMVAFYNEFVDITVD